MCLAMCLKKQEFQADCVYKLGVYKKKVCIPKVIFDHLKCFFYVGKNKNPPILDKFH